MTDHATTLETPLPRSREDAPDRQALVLVWSPAEPHRLGELLWMPALSREKAVVLGRDPSLLEDGERFGIFVRQRPGKNEASTQLVDPGISRRQARFVCGRGGLLTVESLGKTSLYINGKAITEASVLAEGDVLGIGERARLLLTTRPELLPSLRAFPEEFMGEFGYPDALGMTGESPAAWELRDRLAFVARRQDHVLVLGQSGTGKELAAKALHALSQQAKGPLVARNAATIPDGLVAVELFGNAKNYPNPGMAERDGLVGAANHGVLFLDEIGELPEEAQANLLRVLDTDGEYQRLGESRTRRAKVRMVGATNRREESLKHDLRARFVHVVQVPGLADRREDIPLMARSLLAGIGDRDPEVGRELASLAGHSGKAALPLSAALMEALVRHDFKLHVRELNRLLWDSISHSGGEILDLSPEMAQVISPVAQDALPMDVGGEPAGPAILAALARHKGNKSAAANDLGLSSRYALHRLIKRLGLAV